MCIRDRFGAIQFCSSEGLAYATFDLGQVTGSVIDEARLLIRSRPLRKWAWPGHVTWLPPVVCLDVLNTCANFGAIGLLVPEIWPMVTFQHRFLAWPRPLVMAS